MEDISRLNSARRHLHQGRVAEAIREYMELAHQGSAEAAYCLGNLYQSGRSVPKDLRKTEDYFKLSHDRGYAIATYHLAGVYWYESKLQEALTLYKSIANKNPSAAFWAFRCLKRLALGRKELEEEAQKYLIQAKNMGHIEALRIVSIQTAMGKYGLSKIPTGIVQLFSVAAVAQQSMRNGDRMKYIDSLHRIGFKMYSLFVARGKT